MKADLDKSQLLVVVGGVAVVLVAQAGAGAAPVAPTPGRAEAAQSKKGVDHQFAG